MYDYDQKPELNITPLVDIMLVLLAILMVTAPVMEYQEPINLPRGSKTKKLLQVQKINITISNMQTVRVNKNHYKYINFADSFVLFAKNKNRNLPVYIRADKNLKYDTIIYILKSVKEAGFLKVSLVTDG